MKWIVIGVVATIQIGVYAVPEVASAQGLVPQCNTGIGSEPCQACHLVQLIKNVVDWLVLVLSFVATLLFAWAGTRLVISRGAEGIGAAKETFRNVIIGYLLLLAGWLMIDTLLKALVKDQVYGMWNAIQCVEQPIARIVHPAGYEDRGRGVASGALAGNFSPAQAAALAGLAAPDDKVAEAARQAGLDEEQTRNLQALMRVESNGCRAMTSPAGAVGCMQIMPGTARAYDSSLQGLSDAQVRERLMNNDYNIAMGARIYSDLYRQYGGDTRLVYAAYNGGPGANNPSRDCPGMRRWECEWDNQERTVRNTGYQETRNYVLRIQQVSSQLRR